MLVYLHTHIVNMQIVIIFQYKYLAQSMWEIPASQSTSRRPRRWDRSSQTLRPWECPEPILQELGLRCLNAKVRATEKIPGTFSGGVILSVKAYNMMKAKHTRKISTKVPMRFIEKNIDSNIIILLGNYFHYACMYVWMYIWIYVCVCYECIYI